jgi:glycerol-3-phosphate dehydrogenase subunit B
VSELSLVVIGGGAAGTAAAWRAARGGAKVTLLTQRAGATELFSGALDLEPWEHARELAIGADVHGFAQALGVWAISDGWRRVATASGVVRRARGIDTALLDLEPLARAHVAVADSDREGGDGQLLARALQDSDWAETTGTRFSAVPVSVVREPGERYFSDYDFALLHEEPSRLAWLAQQLRSAGSSHDAWLLGNWLGATRSVGPALRDQLGLAVGETTSLPGGPAGARFAAQRDQLLAGCDVRVIEARVRVVEAAPGGWVVELSPSEHRASAPERVLADAVLLAVGGLIGGGLRLAAANEWGGPGIRLAFRAPVPVTLDGSDLVAVGSLHGIELGRLGVAALERVGIGAEGPAVRGHARLFAAGDCVAGRPRTVLEAVRSGIEAARIALGKPPEPSIHTSLP